MDINDEDILLLEKNGEVVLKKGKTILDYRGSLPKLEITIGEMREKAIEEVAKENT